MRGKSFSGVIVAKTNLVLFQLTTLALTSTPQVFSKGLIVAQ
jgi:hypothetical protein